MNAVEHAASVGQTITKMRRDTRRELASFAAMDPAFWEDLMARVAGGEGLRAICIERVWHYGTVYGAIRNDERLSAMYDEAKRGQAEYKVDEAAELVDSADNENLNVVKLRSEFAMKVAGKWDRQRYGEKVEHSGTMLVGSVSDVLRAISERKRAALAEKVIPPEPVAEQPLGTVIVPRETENEPMDGPPLYREQA